MATAKHYQKWVLLRPHSDHRLGAQEGCSLLGPAPLPLRCEGRPEGHSRAGPALLSSSFAESRACGNPCSAELGPGPPGKEGLEVYVNRVKEQKAAPASC